MTLEALDRITVSEELLRETQIALREAGEEGFELFVLWSGEVDGSSGRVLAVHVPEQTSYKTPNGLVVRVEGEALHRLNVWLFDNAHVLLTQVHAHPTDAFHSDTDDAFPIVTTLGGLSVVVPDFAQHDVFGAGTRAYRLTRAGWLEIPEVEMDNLFEVVSA